MIGQYDWLFSFEKGEFGIPDLEFGFLQPRRLRFEIFSFFFFIFLLVRILWAVGDATCASALFCGTAFVHVTRGLVFLMFGSIRRNLEFSTLDGGYLHLV